MNRLSFFHQLLPKLLTGLLIGLLTGFLLSPAIASAQSQPVLLQKKPQTQKNVAGQFDFYVLAMSWSPDYCAARRDPQQCGKQLGLVLHGLWPQYQRGWPAYCTSELFDRKMMTQFPNLYPSSQLYAHEWEKHGTCSGLTQGQYHQLSQQLKTQLAIPKRYDRPVNPFRTTLDEIKRDFAQANPGMTSSSFAPICSGSGRFFQELRVCYGKDGQPGTCSAEMLKVSQRSCGQPDFLIRSVR
jgi:ribonuclease T2